MISQSFLCCFFFFFNDTATTEIYTLSLHDALPIFREHLPCRLVDGAAAVRFHGRSEEHTSELQSRFDLVCRLLLEKKKIIYIIFHDRKNQNTVSNSNLH